MRKRNHTHRQELSRVQVDRVDTRVSRVAECCCVALHQRREAAGRRLLGGAVASRLLRFQFPTLVVLHGPAAVKDHNHQATRANGLAHLGDVVVQVDAGSIVIAGLARKHAQPAVDMAAVARVVNHHLVLGLQALLHRHKQQSLLSIEVPKLS